MKLLKKGQVSTEYVLIIGMVMLVSLPIIYFALRESNTYIQLNKANDAVLTLAKSADSVYALGPGSKKMISINMPGDVRGYSLANKSVNIQMYVFGGLSDVFATTKADLTGLIPISRGEQRIIVEMLSTGYVRFGEGNDTTPPIITWTSPTGVINYNLITLEANTNEDATCKYDTEDKTYSAMSNSFTGTILTHQANLGILADASYSYFVRCQDSNSNKMTSSTIINFTIITDNGTGTNGTGQTNETYEANPPIVNLMSPIDNSTSNMSSIDFSYNVSDESSISFCQLILNNKYNQSDFNIQKNIEKTFTVQNIIPGNYYWSVNCSDVHGNVGSSETRNLTVNYTLDINPPVVTLIAPVDNTIRNYWLVRFDYQVNDNTSDISSCDLNMYGIMSHDSTISWSITDTPIQEDITETIVMPLFKANYTWNISCTDSSFNSNVGTSETRFLIINTTAGEEAFLDSCAGYCGLNGYIDGLCRQNSGKCNDYIGGTWESGGDQYCPVQTGDFCCCAQEVIN
jgi:uncharacterized protein (UPF0333 family)